ncbi:MAG: metal-dependent hydrolase [Candidatus Nanohaloarchaea archaeon]
MGDFTEHVLFGFLAAAIVSYFSRGLLDFRVYEMVASSIALVVGSVLPDIDHKNSYVHRAAKAFLSLGTALSVILFAPLPIHLRFSAAAAVFLLVYVTFSHLRLRHRGFAHSITFGLMVTAVLVLGSAYTLFTPVPGLAAGIGLASHLLLDGEFKFD